MKTVLRFAHPSQLSRTPLAIPLPLQVPTVTVDTQLGTNYEVI